MKKSDNRNVNDAKYASLIYILISYSITWAILFPLSLNFNQLNLFVREIWHSFGSVGPCIGGIITLYILKGKEGLTFLKNKIIKYSGKKLLLFSLSPLLILLITLIIEYLCGFFLADQFIQENNISNIESFIIFLLPSFCYGFFEEIGWRGYLLPRLQSKNSAILSTFYLTVIWWFWHLPTFFYRFDLFFALVLMFPLMLTGSIVFTYLFNQSNGSILMSIILHICYDIVTSHQISITAIIIVSAFFIFMDIRIIKVYGLENFSTKEKITL